MTKLIFNETDGSHIGTLEIEDNSEIIFENGMIKINGLVLGWDSPFSKVESTL